MQWMLSSSSGGSSKLAAKYGMGLAVAKFINGNAQPDMVVDYKKDFIPSDQFAEPVALVAIMVLCAETEEKASQMRQVLNYRFVQMEKGNFDPIGSYDEIKDYEFSPLEQQRIKTNANRIISGTPAKVKDALTSLADDFGVDEIMVTTLATSFEDRKRSFELLAEAFALRKTAAQQEAR